MTGNYRDELSAARERIADLEAKLAEREAPPAMLVQANEPAAFPPVRRQRQPPMWTIVVAILYAVVGTVCCIILQEAGEDPLTPRMVVCGLALPIGTFYAIAAACSRA